MRLFAPSTGVWWKRYTLVCYSAFLLDAPFRSATWVAWNQPQGENWRSGYQELLQISLFSKEPAVKHFCRSLDETQQIFMWPSLLGDSDAARVWAALAEKAFPAHLQSPSTLPLPLPSPILPHPHAQCLSLELASLQIYLCFTQPDFTHGSMFPMLLLFFLYRKRYDFSPDPGQIPALSYIYVQDSIRSYFF